MVRQKVSEIASEVFLGSVAFLIFAWVLFAALSRMFAWD